MSDPLQDAPRVSVGFPVRNGGKFLAAAIGSLLQQSEQNFEIIVSDNGSDDGSGDYLQALAARDSRIKYFKQNPAIRAYDNFYFVLSQAQGQYFMWAAHDDTRDLDYMEKLAGALDRDPKAVLAFGDLNVVTPEIAEGTIQQYSFATTGLGQWARMSKMSRLQCFNIYGLWRTEAIRLVPYAYCAWWPDLPMMLAAAFLGEFKYVPGTRFNYFEVSKNGLDRVKYQDFSARFNLLFGVFGLIAATFRACSKVGGLFVGAFCAALVALKQAINFPGFLYRRVRRLFIGA